MNGELSGVSALLVDDDTDNLELIGYVLERAGCRVVTAHTAAAAIEALGKERFGLFLSDIGLPDQDGIALLREVRARGYDLPAIALTGYAGPEHAQKMSEAGYARHIAKPVDLAALLSAAKEIAHRTHPA
jgi:two-component system, chemotaxis family, CheB/CheR fusion protein